MADKESAQAALYAAIETAAVRAKAVNSAGVAGSLIRDLSIAWRALAGGEQPGSVVIEK